MKLRELAFEENGGKTLPKEICTMEDYLEVEAEVKLYEKHLYSIEKHTEALISMGDKPDSNYVNLVMEEVGYSVEGAVSMKVKNILAWFAKVYKIVSSKLKELIFKYSISLTNYLNGSYGVADKIKEKMTESGLTDEDKFTLYSDRLRNKLPDFTRNGETPKGVSAINTYIMSNDKRAIDDRFSNIFTLLHAFLDGTSVDNSIFRQTILDGRDGVLLNGHSGKPSILTFTEDDNRNVKGVTITIGVASYYNIDKLAVKSKEIMDTIELLNIGIKNLSNSTKNLAKTTINEYGKLKAKLDARKPTDDVQVAKWEIDARVITSVGIRAITASFHANGDYLKNLIAIQKVLTYSIGEVKYKKEK